MAATLEDYHAAREKLDAALSLPPMNKELHALAATIEKQVESIRLHFKHIPVAELTIALDSVLLAVINPSPESALMCWEAGQSLLAYKEPPVRNVGQNLLLMAGGCCFVAGLTVLIASQGTLAPAASALFLASKLAIEGSTHLAEVEPSRKNISGSPNVHEARSIMAEFKQCLQEFRLADIAKKNVPEQKNHQEPTLNQF